MRCRSAPAVSGVGWALPGWRLALGQRPEADNAPTCGDQGLAVRVESQALCILAFLYIVNQSVTGFGVPQANRRAVRGGDPGTTGAQGEGNDLLPRRPFQHPKTAAGLGDLPRSADFVERTRVEADDCASGAEEEVLGRGQHQSGNVGGGWLVETPAVLLARLEIDREHLNLPRPFR